MLYVFITDEMARRIASLPSLLNSEYNVRTVVQPCFHQSSEKKSVIQSGFLSTEVTGDGLDVMIGIHEHGRQQLAVVTAEWCIKVDDRRWVVQEAVHQGLDHTRDGSDVFEYLRILLLFIILIDRFLNILVGVLVGVLVSSSWEFFIFLEWRFNEMTRKDRTRKKRSKSFIYSLAIHLSIDYSWIDNINSCYVIQWSYSSSSYSITNHSILTKIVQIDKAERSTDIVE